MTGGERPVDGDETAGTDETVDTAAVVDGAADGAVEAPAEAPQPAGDAVSEVSEASAATVRRPSSAAAAASRARRIGGRIGPVSTATTPAAGAEPGAESGGKSGAELDAEPATAEPQPPLFARVARPGEADYPQAPPSPRGAVADGLLWLPAGLLGTVAVALAVIIVVLSHGVWWDKPAAATVRDQVLAAAKTCTVAINSYSYTTLPKYETAALACTTGTLTSELRNAIDSIVKPRAPQLKASQTVQVNNAGIESVSGGQWTVLVFGQLTLTSSDYPKGTQAPFAAEVRMQKAHGTWLLAVENTLGGAPTGGSSAAAPSATPSTTPSGR